MHQNLIISSIPELLSGPEKATSSYLTYFKLRIAVRYTYGGFSITDELSRFTGLRKRTLREHVQECIRQGWVRVDPYNSARYTIVSQYSFTNPDSRKHLLAVSVEDEFILNTNWKNISRFRALLQELENQRYVRYRTYKERKATSSSVTQRDHVPVRAQAKRKGGNGSINGQPITEFSCGLASSLTGISPSTASRYQAKLNNLVTYTPNRRYNGKAYPGCEDILDQMNRTASQSEKLSDHGKYYVSRGSIYFCGISSRTSTLRIRRLQVR